MGKQLKLSPIISFAAGILYILSPIIFTRIVAGYVYYLVAYLLAPLILANFLKGREENRNKYFVISGVLLSFAFIQLQFIVLVFIILLIFSLIDFRNIRKRTQGLLITLSIRFSHWTCLLLYFLKCSLQLSDSLSLTLIDFCPHTTRSILAPDLLEEFQTFGLRCPSITATKISLTSGIIPTWIHLFEILRFLL